MAAARIGATICRALGGLRGSDPAGPSPAPSLPSPAEAAAAPAPALSVVIPSYNERANLVRTIRHCAARAAHPASVEVVVADGGSADGTPGALLEAAESLGVPLRVVSAPGGRGYALRAGVAAARGDLVLMLHAECTPPLAYDALCADTLADPGVVLGAFSFKVDRSTLEGPPPAGLSVMERFANVRARAPFQLPYGDQGLHARRSDIVKAGSVPAVAIMEDVLLVKRLLALGRGASPPRGLRVRDEPLPCSGRRWERLGVVWVTVLNQCFVAAHLLGCSPAQIYSWYYGRPPPVPRAAEELGAHADGVSKGGGGGAR